MSIHSFSLIYLVSLNSVPCAHTDNVQALAQVPGRRARGPRAKWRMSSPQVAYASTSPSSCARFAPTPAGVSPCTAAGASADVRCPPSTVSALSACAMLIRYRPQSCPAPPVQGCWPLAASGCRERCRRQSASSRIQMEAAHHWSAAASPSCGRASGGRCSVVAHQKFELSPGPPPRWHRCTSHSTQTAPRRRPAAGRRDSSNGRPR